MKSRDVFGSPTIENGELTSLWGYPINTDHWMCKASTNRQSNASGLIDVDTQANNTKGQILAVRWDKWLFGWRRRMSLETTRIAAADSTEIVAMMRAGMIQRDTEASAITYNLTV